MIFSYIVIVTCVWWIIFYMTLPFGNKAVTNPEIGHADSAPTNPHLGKKLIITSILAIIISICLIYLLEHGYFTVLAKRANEWISGI